jgi:hypothetical protein
MKNSEALTFRIPKGLFRHVTGQMFTFKTAVGYFKVGHPVELGKIEISKRCQHNYTVSIIFVEMYFNLSGSPSG